MSNEDKVEHGYADSNGVKIHYAALGSKENPMILFIHGYPDFWYSWKDIMESLSNEYYTVAMDQRGYNLSDKPKGEENYHWKFLVNDALSVIQQLGFKKAIVAGHDWGGFVAWILAMGAPHIVDKLIVLNLPHPRGINYELVNNPNQQKASQYARNYQQPEAHTHLSPELLLTLFRITKNEDEKKYAEAFNRSDFEAMLSYYKQNYPKEPYTPDTSPVIKIKMPVLQIHGLDDSVLLRGALNNTWDWLESDLTLVTIPNAGHFVHHDQPDLVKRTITMWLKR